MAAKGIGCATWMTGSLPHPPPPSPVHLGGSVLHEGHIHGSPFKLHVLLPPARPEPLDSDAKAAGQRLQDDSG